jgi:hypothetical protein
MRTSGTGAGEPAGIRTMNGEYLNSIAEELDEKYRSEPARYRDSACTPCLGPLLTPMVVVERETWEALFHATTLTSSAATYKYQRRLRL